VAEGEGHEDKEDLFEDLDKFFAPIQDVEWPETVEGPPVPGEPEPGREPSEPEPQREPEPSEPEVTSPIGEEEVVLPEAEEEPAGEELFAGPPAEPEEAAWAAPAEEEEEGGIEAFLFAEQEEPEAEIGEAIVVERLTHAPEAYVDLPGPGGEGEEPEVEEAGVAEPIEEAPSAEEVEAAAEHFAESVREEVSEAPEAVTGYDTEPEAGIEELLGVEEEEAPAGEEAEVPVRTVRVGDAEALGGPSWQEPTAVEVGPEVERGGPGRNVQVAFLTGIALAALAVGAIALGPGPFAVLAGIVVLVAQGEFYFALQKRHYQPATALGLVTGALVLGAAYYSGEPAMLAMTALGVIASFLWYMTVPAQHRRNVVSNIGLTVLGIVWIPMLAGYILVLLPYTDGRALVVSILGLTIAYDASAFAVGYFWGSRPLAPSISPKKSWEGAIGATLVVIAIGVGVVASAVELLDTIPRAVGLAVVVALFAPFGDLAESIVKRDLGIKDMGSVLPGHGGVLDRIDGMLFVVPAAVLYLRLILA
jgi:phosphatidate cytidylyltransferase